MMFIHTKPAASAWPAAMIVWGPGYRATAHRHHSIQLIMATKGTFRIRGGRRDRWLRCGAALVRPDAVHEIDARATPVLIAFVDVESSLGLALNEAIESDIFSTCTLARQTWSESERTEYRPVVANGNTP